MRGNTRLRPAYGRPRRSCRAGIRLLRGLPIPKFQNFKISKIQNFKKFQKISKKIKVIFTTSNPPSALNFEKFSKENHTTVFHSSRSFQKSTFYPFSTTFIFDHFHSHSIWAHKWQIHIFRVTAPPQFAYQHHSSAYIQSISSVSSEYWVIYSYYHRHLHIGGAKNTKNH